MILNDGTDWQPDPEDIEKWTEAYSAISVTDELKKMDAWLHSNPIKRKTRRGIKRFVNTWLSKAHDRGGSPSLNYKRSEVKQMTMDDELSHNFTNDPQIREYFMEKYGQCFEDGVRYTQ